MLLRGEGRYTDDVSLPGQAYAVMVRSRNAHGNIRAIHLDAARSMPGVLGVYTAADLQAYGPLKCIIPFKNRDGSPMKKPWRGALAKDKVRYVGDPVACVVAETVLAAKDAAEAVEIDIEPLPAVIAADEAVRADAPLLYDDVPGNVPLDYHFGDADAVTAAFAKAAHVTRLEHSQQPRRGQRHGAARGARLPMTAAASPFTSPRRASTACAPTSPRRSASRRRMSAF